MKSKIRFRLLVCMLLLASQGYISAQTPPKVSKIEIKYVGPASVSESLIRSNIRVKEGEPFLRPSADDDVRNLYATGFFHNIQVAEKHSDAGVELTYVVQAKPTLTAIKYSGNKKYDNSKLRKKVKSKIGDPLDEQKLFVDSQEIQKMYQKAGYPRTTVKPALSIDENTGRGTATFEIQESPKVRIKKVEFAGASAYPPKKLREVVTTKKRWAFSWLTGSGVLKDDKLEDDKDKLAEFYRNNGYIDFDLKDVQFDYINRKQMVVRFVISEGRRYKVGSVEYKGNTLFPTSEVSAKTKLKAGSVFSPRDLSEDLGTIRDFYGRQGYIGDSSRESINVQAVRSPNITTGTMDLVYEIEEGDKSFIEKIEIKGNTKTKDQVIRRELAVAPGEVFDTVKIKLSQQRLEGLNYFQKVDTAAEPTDVPNRKNLVIGVEEKNTGNFTLGAGFSSVDAIVGFVEVTQGNFDLFKPPTFTGGGQKFRLRVSVGTERKDFQVSFIEPWFLEKKLALGIDLYHREYNFLSRRSYYDQTQSGGRVSLTRALGSDFLIGGVSYTLENIGIHDVDRRAPMEIKREEGNALVSRFGASIAFDTRNSTMLPDKGQRTELITEIAGGPFGGDYDFYKVEAKSSWYFPGFFKGHVLEVSGRGGVVEEFGSSSYVPLFDRWFLGGLYSLRGYRYRDVGPRTQDTTPIVDKDEPVGGNTYWFGSLEYSLPIIERLRFAMFYDIGNVYEDSWSLSVADNPNFPDRRRFYSDNWGIGLRLNLPIGPLRLDYGIPISHDKDVSGSGRFQFGVGYTREF